MVIFLMFLTCSSPTLARQITISEESRALILNVIDSLNNLDHPKMGRGKAKVSDELHNMGDNEFEFMFLGSSSRSDSHRVTGIETGGSNFVWSYGPKGYVGYNTIHASVELKPTRQFYQRFGLDFHPESFIQTWGGTIGSYLEAVLKGHGGTVTTIMEGNVLNIELHYDEADGKEIYKISLDTSKGFRPVYWRLESGNTGQKIDDVIRTSSIEWEKYSNGWFVKSASLEREGFALADNGEISSKVTSTRIEIIEYDPEAKVTEEDFLLSGIGIPDGTTVFDEIVGFSYEYGTGLNSTEALAMQLESTSILDNYNDKKPKNIDTESIDTDKEIIDSVESPTRNSTLAATVDQTESFSWYLIISVIFICIVLAAIGLYFYKYKVVKK